MDAGKSHTSRGYPRWLANGIVVGSGLASSGSTSFAAVDGSPTFAWDIEDVES
jgi:hypothetical protein